MPNSITQFANMANEVLANGALVEAFNVNNCTRGIMDTNFTTDGHRISMVFGGDMNQNKCQEYLKNLRDRINGAFYQSSHGVQGPFNLDFFPFNAHDGIMLQDETSGKFKYEVSITDEVLFNLQSHLMHSMVKPTEVEMTKPIKVKPTGVQLTQVKPRTVIKTYPFDSNEYVMCSSFESKELAEDFKKKFCAEMVSLQCDLSRFVEVKVEVRNNNIYNNVYIKKDIVKNVAFIQKCVQYNAGKIGYSLDEDSGIDSDDVTVLMKILTQFVCHTTGIVIDSYYLTSYPGSDEKSTLLPTIAVKGEEGKKKGSRFLNAAEVHAINHAFGFPVVNNLAACVSDERIISEQDKETYGIHGIDFFNKDVCQCVFDHLFENALVTKVGKEYELEVQRSPHLDKLRAKVDEMREKEAQLQEAQSRAGAAQSYAKAAQSHAEEAKLRAEEAQSCANTTLSSTESAQLRAEATQSSAKAAQFRVEATHSHAEAAQWYAEAAYLRAEMTQSAGGATQLRAEAAQFCAKATRLYAEVTRLQKEIEAKGKKQKKVYADACHQVDSLDRRSITSGSSDDTDNHPKVSDNPNGGWQGASRSHPAGSSGGTDPNAGKKGQGQGRGGSQDRAQGHHRSTKLPYGTHPDYVVDPGYCGSSSDITGGLSGKTAAKSASADKSASVDKLKNPDSKKRSSPYTWIKSFFSRSKKGTTPLKRANSESGVSESGVFVNTPAQTPGSTPKTVRKSPNGLPNGANTNLTGVRTEQTANVAKESCVVS